MEHALPDAPVDALDEGLRASVLSPSDSRVLTRVSFVSRDRVRVLGLPGLGIAAGDEMVVSDPILVGDWVVVDTGHAPFLVIHRVPRSSVLQRRKPKGGKQEVAANVDLALVCTPLGATAGPRRVERWLAIAAEAGIEALVVVTKVDPDVEAELDRDAYGDATVLGVSGRFGTGIPALLQRLPSGRTAALLGASGVGKSTLLNALLGREAQRVGAVRESDQRGRHTTTARTLHVLPQGAYLIDNPGVREVGLTRAHGVDAAFPEIERCWASVATGAVDTAAMKDAR